MRTGSEHPLSVLLLDDRETNQLYESVYWTILPCLLERRLTRPYLPQERKKRRLKKTHYELYQCHPSLHKLMYHFGCVKSKWILSRALTFRTSRKLTRANHDAQTLNNLRATEGFHSFDKENCRTISKFECTTHISRIERNSKYCFGCECYSAPLRSYSPHWFALFPSCPLFLRQTRTFLSRRKQIRTTAHHALTGHMSRTALPRKSVF